MPAEEPGKFRVKSTHGPAPLKGRTRSENSAAASAKSELRGHPRVRPHGPLRAPKLHAWAARRRAKEPVPKSGATGKDAPAAHEERKTSRVSLPPRAPREGFRWAGGAHSKTTAKACALGTHAGAVATYRGERALQTARNWAAAWSRARAAADPCVLRRPATLRRCSVAEVARLHPDLLGPPSHAEPKRRHPAPGCPGHTGRVIRPPARP